MTSLKNTDYKRIVEYCDSKIGVSASYPFGEGTLAFKVMGKVFALIPKNDDPLRMNLKCDPDDAQALRAQYPAIIPGFHMNKKHWNTVLLDGTLPSSLVAEMIDQSYDLVVAGLKIAEKDTLSKIIQQSKLSLR